MNKKWCAGVCFVVGVLLTFPARSIADSLTPKMISEDGRLVVTLNLSSRRMYVGDLLARIRGITGVDVSADLRDGAADQQIAFELKDVKLFDAMDAMWGLFSYKGGDWHWDRLGAKGSYSYVLEKPIAARGLAHRLKDLAQQIFEEQTKTLMRFARMSPKEREKKKGELSTALLQDDDKLADAYLRDGRVWSALRIFSDATGNDEIHTVLQGDITKSLPVSGLSDESKAFVHSVWLAGQFRRKRAPDADWEPVPEPDEVKVYAKPLDGMLASSLFVDLKGIGGYGYSGGTPLDNMLKEKLRRLWMHPGDLDDVPNSGATVSAPTKQVQASSQRPVGARLQELSRSVTLSFIARLPREQRDPGPPYTKTIGSFLSNLREQPPHAYSKWRAGILLVDHPGWYLAEPSIVPWSIATSIRNACSVDSGFLGAEHLFRTAATLDLDQMHALAEDYPYMDAVAELYPLFHEGGRSPIAMSAILSARGFPLTDETIQYFRQNDRLRPLLVGNRPSALRLVQQAIEQMGTKMREYTFECMGSDGTWKPVVGFRAAPTLASEPQ